MNAYELADELDKLLTYDTCDQYVPDETPNMLRQQGDELEQLREMEKYFYLHAPMEYQAYLNRKDMK